MGLLELLSILGPQRFSQLMSELPPERRGLANLDPARKVDSVIPNVYRGLLQPDMESGKSLPPNYNPNQKRRI